MKKTDRCQEKDSLAYSNATKQAGEVGSGKKSYAPTEKIKRVKARIGSKVEHPFWVVRLQFGYIKVRYRFLKKNTAQLKDAFALFNFWMVRRKLMGIGGAIDRPAMILSPQRS